jgi:hypothetical protein
VTDSAFPVIDPRIRTVGIAKLRGMNATFLRNMKDEAYMIQSENEPLAFLVSYETYLKWQAQVKELYAQLAELDPQ